MQFVEILDQYNIEYKTEGHHHCRPGWIQIDCPFCEPGSKNFHMGYNIAENYVNCYRCGSHSLVDTLAEMTNKSIHECIEILKGIKGQKVVKKKHDGKLTLPCDIQRLTKAHVRYLKKRGFDQRQLIKLWGIKGIGLSSKYQWRIFIPVYYHGKVVTWSTRSIGQNSPRRYLHAPPKMEDIPIKELLYGEDYVRDTIIIEEGFTDVWNTGPGAVATMGVGYTQMQLEKMIKYPTRVVCFDNAPTAQKRAAKLCDDLGSFPGDTFNVVLDAADPGEASRKEIDELRKEFSL